MFKNFICKNKSDRGFNILEVIISVSIITIGILAIANLFFVLIKAAATNKNKIIANYLAEENIEIIRQMRDTNWLNGFGWDQGINNNDRVAVAQDPNDIRLGFEIDSKNPNSAKVYEDDTGGYFQKKAGDTLPFSWKDTNFTRWLTIAKPDTQTMEIVSYVYYKDEAEPIASVRTIFKDWKN